MHDLTTPTLRCKGLALSLALGVALTPSTPGHAQERQGGLAGTESCIPFETAISAAIGESPRVAVAEAARDRAGAAVSDVRSTFRPQLSAFARTQAGDNGLTANGIENQVGLRASQRLYDFGATRQARLAADADLAARRFDIDSAARSAAQTAATLYLQYTESQARLAATTDRLDYFRRQRDGTRESLEVGGATRSDLAEIEARLAEAEADRTNLQFQTERFARQLETETGQPGRPCTEDTGSIVLPLVAPADISAAREAVGRHPQLVALDRATRAAAARSKGAQRNRLPAIDVVGIVSYADDGIGDDWQLRDRVGIDVSVPLLSGRALNAERSRFAAEEAGIRAERRDLERQLLEQADLLFRLSLSLAVELDRRAAVVEQKSLQFDAAEVEFDAGLRILPELVEDRLELENARLALIQTRFEALQVQVDLAALTGALVPAPMRRAGTP